MNFKSLENPNHDTVDVIIMTMPWTNSRLPLMAPAVLKPIVEKANLSCLAVDTSVEFLNEIKNRPNLQDYLEFFFDGRCQDLEIERWVHDALLSLAKQCMTWKPKFIGLSLFTYASRPSALWLCYFLKKMDPSIKIILGGAGCLEQFTGPAYFADQLIEKKLADFHIRGDGEQSLYELLVGNLSYPGINDTKWKQLEKEDLTEIPCPDYSDYDFSFYEKKIIPLQGSKGCVRKCTFCDYIENWTKFQWRSADHIFAEMLEQYKKYKIRNFKFQDTLTNGNLKEFNRLITLLSEYNKQNPNDSFRWSGHYIFREKKSSDDQEWQMIADSGASILIVGIENLNQDIRYAIGKKFSNEAIDYHLEQALKHNVKLGLLFITGYVTETQAHVEFSKRWLDSHTKYQPIISYIQWGSGLGIFPNTYLDRNKDKLGIKMVGPQPHMWINPSIGSTPKIRAKWANELNEYGEALGYIVVKDINTHVVVEEAVDDKS